MTPSRLIGLAVGLLLAACAQQGDAARPAAGPSPLDPARAAALISEHARFADPLRIEIPAFAEGPTIDALLTLGLVEVPAGERRALVPTRTAHEAGIERSEFQSDIPVYRLPIGARELVEVLEIRTEPNGRYAVAKFTYRQAPSALGRELIRAGGRLDAVAGEIERDGHAALSHAEDGWRVAFMSL